MPKSTKTRIKLNKKTIKKLSLLQRLVNKITKHNRHNEVDWGFPVGKEVW